jgi:hypothetical protein
MNAATTADDGPVGGFVNQVNAGQTAGETGEGGAPGRNELRPYDSQGTGGGGAPGRNELRPYDSQGTGGRSTWAQ